MPSVKGYGQNEQSALAAAKNLLPDQDITKYRKLEIRDAKRDGDRYAVEIQYTLQASRRSTRAPAPRGAGAAPESREAQLIEGLTRYEK